MMNLKTQKIVTAVLDGIVVVGGLQVLMYLLGINQMDAYVQVALWIWVLLMFKIIFLYDLHFKVRGSWGRAKEKHESISHWLHRDIRVVSSAVWHRLRHFHTWAHVKQALVYMVLPTLLFWSTVVVLYLNFSFIRSQQIFFVLSSMALILNFWYLKELFHRKTEQVENDIFVALSVVKVYTAAIAYGAALGIMRSYCLQPRYYVAVVLAVTFLLIHQALFQHKYNTVKNLFYTLLISIAVAGLGYVIYVKWGYNFYTAAIFITAFYNFLWGIFHYHLDRSLTKRAFYEILLISLLIGSMVLGITNFRERLLDSCVNPTNSGYQF
jgi:hypothetical protein